MLPTFRLDPELVLYDRPTDDRQFVCIDRSSEEELQKWRRLAYLVGGPLVAMAGIGQRSKVFGLAVVGLGVACSFYHFKSYQKVQELLEGAP